MTKHLKKYNILYLFIGLSFLISWGSLLLGNTEFSFPWFLAKFGFSISAIILILVFKDDRRKNDILRSIKHFKLWYIVIGLSPIVAYIVSIVLSVPVSNLSVVHNQSLIDWMYILLISPSSGILFYSLFRGGLGEEIGLRGLIVPYLAEQKSLFKTACIIGIFWSVWHYPVWIPLGAVNLIVGTIATIAWSMIFTLVYTKTQSLGLVILLHATGNASDDIFEWVFPQIIDYDWEILYILQIIIIGIICGIFLHKTPNVFNKIRD